MKKQIKVNNSDIEEKLQSLSINEIFFGSRNKDIYLQLVDMIYNSSIHLSLSGIPIQRTIKPGKKKPSWVRDIPTEEKQVLSDVHLYDHFLLQIGPLLVLHLRNDLWNLLHLQTIIQMI